MYKMNQVGGATERRGKVACSGIIRLSNVFEGLALQSIRVAKDGN